MACLEEGGAHGRGLEQVGALQLGAVEHGAVHVELGEVRAIELTPSRGGDGLVSYPPAGCALLLATWPSPAHVHPRDVHEGALRHLGEARHG